MKKKYVLSTASIAAMICALPLACKAIKVTDVKRQMELSSYINTEQIVELGALKEKTKNASFKSTKEVIEALESTSATVLHIGEYYVSKEGGPINVINYYGECKMIYNEGDEVPFGCYVDNEGYLVKNCDVTPVVTENGVIYLLPPGYVLKQETVVEESISYQDFLSYDIDVFETVNPITEEYQKGYYVY